MFQKFFFIKYSYILNCYIISIARIHALVWYTTNPGSRRYYNIDENVLHAPRTLFRTTCCTYCDFTINVRVRITARRLCTDHGGYHSQYTDATGGAPSLGYRCGNWYTTCTYRYRLPLATNPEPASR